MRPSKVDRMSRGAQLAICFYLLTAPAQGQQVASANLSRLSVPTTRAGMEPKPNDCEGLRPRAIGDSFVEAPDREAREIAVEMASVGNQGATIGGVMQGEVQVRNIGTQPIQIPWSADPTVRGKGQNARNSKTGPAAVEWEEGNFKVYLQGSGLLKNLSQPLFSSKFAPGSQITIRPGEWVTARIAFKIEPEYPLPERSIKEGDARLVVEWEQTAISGAIYRNGCLVGSLFSHYVHYYKQQNPAISITVH